MRLNIFHGFKIHLYFLFFPFISVAHFSTRLLIKISSSFRFSVWPISVLGRTHSWGAKADDARIQMRLWGVGWLHHASDENGSVFLGVATAASEAAGIPEPSGFWWPPGSFRAGRSLTHADGKCLLVWWLCEDGLVLGLDMNETGEAEVGRGWSGV